MKNIIATIGLFVGIWATIALVINNVKYNGGHNAINSAWASLGWTVFISAMWIF